MKAIQWFPGHMAKARREVEEKLRLVDIVYVLLDARIPYSSMNPMLEEIIQQKPRLYLLNKSDLADPKVTAKWLSYFQTQKIPAVAINSLTKNPLSVVLEKSKEILADLFQKEASKGMKERPIRAMVLGIPNVGKSQFINQLCGKTKAKTGNKPGITKMQVYLRAGDNLELLDNPGILWPKFESQDVAMNLALIGSIKDDILPLDEITLYGIDYVRNHYPKALVDRYGIELSDSLTNLDILDEIGKKRGCLVRGGDIDYDRVYQLYLYELRNRQLGEMSFESVESCMNTKTIS